MSEPELFESEISLEHADGSMVGARLLAGGDRGWVVVGGATATPQRYYRPLARWLAETHHVNVVTFDYRGIGASKAVPLRDETSDYRDWADDLALAVAHAARQGPAVVVGHSFGGMAFGMTDAHEATRGLYTFGTGAGWHGYMPWGEAIRVWTLWNVLGPPLVAWRGYLPMSAVGLGEDIPLGVYRDWKRWCRWPRFFFDDPEADFGERFARVRVPVVGVNSVDDPWAPPESGRAFLSHYPTAELVAPRPPDLGLPAIGHMGYVRRSRAALWRALGSWLEERLSRR